MVSTWYVEHSKQVVEEGTTIKSFTKTTNNTQLQVA